MFVVEEMKRHSGDHCADVPTKPRIKALLLKQKLLNSYYPSRSVIAIGIALTVCGVTMTIFGFVALLIEASMSNLWSGVWIGLSVFVTGIVGISSGNRPHSTILLHTHLFTSIFTTGITGFMTILTANSVARDNHNSVFHSQDQLQMNYLKTPAIMINSFLLMISALSGILSCINFCLCGREACQCYSKSGLLGIQETLNQRGVDTLLKHDRVLSWIIQQSTTSKITPEPQSPSSSRTPSPKQRIQLKPSNASTNSTRLSAYKT